MATTSFWKLRHKPTGLFYKPSVHRSKANLTKDGKVYNKRPSLAQTSGINAPLPKEEMARLRAKFSDRETRRMTSWSDPEYQRYQKGYYHIPTLPHEWEVVEYRMVEHAVHPATREE